MADMMVRNCVARNLAEFVASDEGKQAQEHDPYSWALTVVATGLEEVLGYREPCAKMATVELSELEAIARQVEKGSSGLITIARYERVEALNDERHNDLQYAEGRRAR
jgi:hypothetical protein